MNISVEEINIVNDGMYEIYTKFGMKIAIDVLKKRFSNITKEDTKTIKLLSCFVNYMKKKGVRNAGRLFFVYVQGEYLIFLH